MYAELVRATRPKPKATIHIVHASSYRWNEIQNLMRTGETARSDLAAWAHQVEASLSVGRVIILAAEVFQGRDSVVVGYSILNIDRHEIESLWVAPTARGLGVADQLYGFSLVNIGTVTPTAFFPRDMRDEVEGICKRVGAALSEKSNPHYLMISA